MRKEEGGYRLTSEKGAALNEDAENSNESMNVAERLHNLEKKKHLLSEEEYRNRRQIYWSLCRGNRAAKKHLC